MIICHAKRIEKQKYTIKKLGPENFLDNIYKVKQVKICVCISLTYYIVAQKPYLRGWLCLKD